ncbi:MAG: penicillin-binding protein 2 [Candidatus Berkelbacteria bacterium]|nr:penicillin-binding protein 2 [Candidatus Berkelbacteria bacterium]
MTPKAKFERTGVLFLVMFFAGGVISFALFQKQVLEHDQYAATSLAQSVSQTDIPAQRGRIFAKDRDKTLVNLAVSEWRYNLVITPQLIKDKQKFADLLSSDYPKMTANDIFAKADSDKVFVILTKGLTIDEADKISKQNYRGVSLVPQLVRSYSEGDAIAAQVLGFVGADGEGKYGVEGARDDILRGKAGSEQQKKDSFGQLIDVLGGKDSTPGQDLVLTIDYNLQYTVESKLKESIDKYKADSGSIIVMDPKTGAILAMAGQPTFDPNNFSLVPSDQQSRFLSPAVSNAYEPGSAMKPLMMAVALDSGKVTPETTNVFGPSVTVLGKVITNAEGKVYGKENMAQVLENSDNVAMAWISSLVGAKTQREYYTKFGFGAKSGVDLVGESAGSLQDEKEWNDLLRSTAAFGQGVSVSLLQLATAYSVVGNGGTLVTPHLAEKTLVGDKVTVIEYITRGQVIKPETAKQVQLMLENVVLNGHGKRAKVAGVRVGGKTGTAQVPDPKGGYYSDRTIGTFAGMFPIEDPRFVMAVRLDNPKTVNFAESSAAPTFGEIAEWMANYYQLR